MEVKYINKVSTSYTYPTHPIPTHHILSQRISFYLILSYPIPSLHIPSHPKPLIPFNPIPSNNIPLTLFLTSHPIPLIIFTHYSIPSLHISSYSSHPTLSRHGEGPRDRNTGPPSSRGREIPHCDERDTEAPPALSSAGKGVKPKKT